MAGMQNIREGLTGNLTKIIVIAIIITFVGSIGWAGFFSQGNANIIAKIGSKQITSTDLSFEAASQQFLLNQRFPDQQIEDEVLMEISIESLIRKFGILDFIENNDLNLTDNFVFKELAKDEQFQENGRFSKQNFDAYARSNGFIPQDYLNRIKQDLILEFWKQSLIKSSFLSEEEVQKTLVLAEQERDISFIKIPATNFSKEVETPENALLDFYNENIDKYFTEKKTRVKYLSLSLEDLKSSIEINDSDIEVLNRMENPVDESLVCALQENFKDFNRAYDKDGMKPEEFESFGATVHTLKTFLGGYDEFINLIRNRMIGE